MTNDTPNARPCLQTLWTTMRAGLIALPFGAVIGALLLGLANWLHYLITEPSIDIGTSFAFLIMIPFTSLYAIVAGLIPVFAYGAPLYALWVCNHRPNACAAVFIAMMPVLLVSILSVGFAERMPLTKALLNALQQFAILSVFAFPVALCLHVLTRRALRNPH